MNGALIAALLTQLLAGSVGLGDFWDALRTSGRSIDDTRTAMRYTLEMLLRPDATRS